MNLIEQKTEVWGEIPLDLESTLTWVEKAGRTCYDSLCKVKLGSARRFVENVIKPVPPHASVLEHSNLVLRSKNTFRDPKFEERIVKGRIQSNFIFTGIQHDLTYIYGNWRAFYEEHKDIDFFKMPFCIEKFYPGYEVVREPGDVPYFAQAATVCFTTDRAVSHEIVRHRHKTAFSQRSQRYCSESNLKIIKPIWYDKAKASVQFAFKLYCNDTEQTYRILKKEKYTSQDARTVLPNCTATVLVMSAYLSEWDWIFYLRMSPAAYPAIRELMKEAKHKMIEMRIIDPE